MTNRAEELITQLEQEIKTRDARIAELEGWLRHGGGYAIVPIEPTPEMVAACLAETGVTSGYQAMIAVAPLHPSPSPTLLPACTAENKRLQKELDQARLDASRWNAFINSARIRFFGWAGMDIDGNKPHTDPYGNDSGAYAHFGAEFWTIHDGKTPDADKARRLLTTYADAALAAGKEGV